MIEGRKKGQNTRFVYFDIESTQDKIIEINGVPVCFLDLQVNIYILYIHFQCYKHIANLLVAEIICAKCIDVGVEPGHDYEKQASHCCCGVFGPKFRYMEHLVEKSNRRLLQFNDFDGTENGTVDQFLDFLLNSGPRGTITYAISHNGGKFDIHILLERIYARQIIPTLVMTGKFPPS
jgi:hypothetical protein